MTKKEIIQAAQNCFPFEYPSSTNTLGMDFNKPKQYGFIVGAEMVNQKQPYTAQDMEAFFSWATNNGWSYGELIELWYNDDEELEVLKIEEVLNLWEEQK